MRIVSVTKLNVLKINEFKKIVLTDEPLTKIERFKLIYSLQHDEEGNKNKLLVFLNELLSSSNLIHQSKASKILKYYNKKFTKYGEYMGKSSVDSDLFMRSIGMLIFSFIFLGIGIGFFRGAIEPM